MTRPAVEIIIALDVETGRQALELAARLEGGADLFKVGLQLFSAEGPSIVQRLFVSMSRMPPDCSGSKDRRRFPILRSNAAAERERGSNQTDTSVAPTRSSITRATLICSNG